MFLHYSFAIQVKFNKSGESERCDEQEQKQSFVAGGSIAIVRRWRIHLGGREREEKEELRVRARYHRPAVCVCRDSDVCEGDPALP